MSYQIYKVIHLASIFLFLAGAAVLLLTEKRTMYWKLFTGITSFFILFGGMGLMARLGGGFQPWIMAKIIIWLVVTGLGHMVAKRFSGFSKQAYWFTIALAITAACIAIYKP